MKNTTLIYYLKITLAAGLWIAISAVAVSVWILTCCAQSI